MAESGRGLGAMERLVDLIDRAKSLNFVVIAHIEGPLAEPDLRRGLDEVQAQHPLLRVRMAPNERGSTVAFVSDGVGRIPLRIVEDASSSDEIEREMEHGFDRASGPLMRCTWLRQGPTSSVLLVTFNHTVGDGTAGAVLLRDLLSRVTGTGPVEAGPLPAPLEAHMPATVRGWSGLWRLAQFVLRMSLRWLSLFGVPRRVRVDRDVPFEQLRPRMIVERLGPERLEALSLRCREHGCTIHGALSAALAFAFLDEEEGGRSRVIGLGSPVNMRSRMSPPVGEDIGLFVSMALTAHRVKAGRDFWDLARETRAELLAAIERRDPFVFAPVLGWLMPRLVGDAMAPDTPVRIARMTRRFLAATTGITNLGRLSLDREYGALTLDRVYFVVSPSAMADLACTAATFNQQLHFGFMFNEPRVSRARAERLAQRAMAHLEAAIGPPAS